MIAETAALSSGLEIFAISVSRQRLCGLLQGMHSCASYPQKPAVLFPILAAVAKLEQRDTHQGTRGEAFAPASGVEGFDGAPEGACSDALPASHSLTTGTIALISWH
jgi:hypothetical protein